MCQRVFATISTNPAHNAELLPETVCVLLVLNKEKDMKVELHGDAMKRYKKLKKLRDRFMFPDNQSISEKIRIRVCHLTPRQKTKFIEMNLEEFD